MQNIRPHLQVHLVTRLKSPQHTVGGIFARSSPVDSPVEGWGASAASTPSIERASSAFESYYESAVSISPSQMPVFYGARESPAGSVETPYARSQTSVEEAVDTSPSGLTTSRRTHRQNRASKSLYPGQVYLAALCEFF
jgi:hypothetical protein